MTWGCKFVLNKSERSLRLPMCITKKSRMNHDHNGEEQKIIEKDFVSHPLFTMAKWLTKPNKIWIMIMDS